MTIAVANTKGPEVCKDEAPESAPLSPRLAPVVEARGGLRAVLAALANLEHLLRSPRIGPRALREVIPGLRDLSTPLLEAADEILAHLSGSAIEPAAVWALLSFVREACGRLATVLDWAAGEEMDAKTRLAFESRIEQLGAELSSARRLFDMLSRAAERAETELHLEQVVEEAFSWASRKEYRTQKPVEVAWCSSGGENVLHASAQVVVSLLAMGAGLVRRGDDDRLLLSVVAPNERRLGLRISPDVGTEKKVRLLYPPRPIPPMLVCAQAAARAGGGAFMLDDGVVTIEWAAGA